MKPDENGTTRSEAEDVRVEVLEELLVRLRRFRGKLRTIRKLIAEHLAPDKDPSVRPPLRRTL